MCVYITCGKCTSDQILRTARTLPLDDHVYQPGHSFSNDELRASRARHAYRFARTFKRDPSLHKSPVGTQLVRLFFETRYQTDLEFALTRSCTFNKYANDCANIWINYDYLTRSLEFLGNLRPAFVAHLAERLTDALCASSQSLADAAGISAPIRTHSVLLFLLEQGSASLTEMARTDGQSHQLLAARLKPIEKLGLIERFTDPNDARRHPYRLTRSGRTEAHLVRAAIGAHARAMDELFGETGVNLVTVLDEALEALRIRPLSERISKLSLSDRKSA